MENLNHITGPATHILRCTYAGRWWRSQYQQHPQEAYSHSLIGLWPGRVGYDSGRALHVHTYIMYVRHMHLTCNSRTRKAAWGFFDAFIWSIFNILCNIFRNQECLIYLIGYIRQLLSSRQNSCGSERAIVTAAQSDCNSKPRHIF